jgi:NinB protein
MTKQKFTLVHYMARQGAIEAVKSAPAGFVVTVQEPKRNLDQNAALWPLLTEFSRQLPWMINGVMTTMTPDEWKDVLTAGFRKETRMASGLDGGFVMMPTSTSRMGKREFSEFLEFCHATAALRGVVIDMRAAA